jgi:hypothetical protein
MVNAYEESLMGELDRGRVADPAQWPQADGGNTFEKRLYPNGCVRLAPIEDLLASIVGTPDGKDSAEFRDKLEKYGGKLRAEQRVELCERLANGGIQPSSFEILWKILFNEEIGKAGGDLSEFYEEIMKSDGSKCED